MPFNDIKFNLAEKRTRNLLVLFSLFPLTLPVRTVAPHDKGYLRRSSWLFMFYQNFVE